jgi:hypothetical protein
MLSQLFDVVGEGLPEKNHTVGRKLNSEVLNAGPGSGKNSAPEKLLVEVW